MQALAGDRSVRVVWLNEIGGITCEVGEGDDRRFVKWCPPGTLDLAGEAARLAWAVRFSPVPVVCDQGTDETGSWLVTRPLPGENAVTDRWKAQPDVATRAIGEALRAFHDALPVETCPFSWSAPGRVADARRRAAAGGIHPDRWHDCHQPLGVDEALRRLADIPDVDRVVVCHGDTCAPNTLITDDGRWSGHVDLGSLGVADRWADLAIATWSTEWNYGSGWERAVLDAYGVDPDPARTAYYRLLWDLGP